MEHRQSASSGHEEQLRAPFDEYVRDNIRLWHCTFEVSAFYQLNLRRIEQDVLADDLIRPYRLPAAVQVAYV